MHVLTELNEAALVVHEDHVLDATPAATAILGYTRDELRNIPSVILLADPRERPDHQARLVAHHAGHASPAHFEARAITRDGEEITLDITITAPDRPDERVHVVVLRKLDDPSTVARAVVRRIVSIISRGPAREATLRSIGREIARSIAPASPPEIETAVARFRAEGLGDIALLEHNGDRFNFRAYDLVERSADGAPCFLALSFLESVVSFASAHECLGAETACQARGAPACAFVVKARSFGGLHEPAVRAPTRGARPAPHSPAEPRSPNLLGGRGPVPPHGP